MIDEEDGVVKKIVYGPDFIELHSINPMYPVRRFENEDVTRIRVFGLVREDKAKILVEFGTNQYKFTSNNIYDKGV